MKYRNQNLASELSTLLKAYRQELKLRMAIQAVKVSS